MAYFTQQLLNGLHMGALYALLAYGYAITDGLLRRANLAHGALFALGGQAMILAATYGWTVLWLIRPLSLAFGVVVAFSLTGLAAYVVGRSVLQPLARQAPNTVMAATLAVAVVLGELGRFAFESRDVWLSPVSMRTVAFWRDGDFAVTLTLVQIANIAVAVFTLALTSAILSRSRFGASWRASCDDPLAAEMCGVDSSRIFRLSAVIAGSFAALAGIMAAVHFGNIGFGTGLFFGLKVLFVAALGFGRTPIVAAVGAAAVGLAESLWSGYFPIEWRDAAVFAALIAIFVLRPPADEVARQHPPPCGEGACARSRKKRIDFGSIRDSF